MPFLSDVNLNTLDSRVPPTITGKQNFVEECNIDNYITFLEVGDTLTLAEIDPDSSICLLMDKWSFKGMLEDHPSLFKTVYSVYKYDFSSYQIHCQYSKKLLLAANLKGIVTIICSNAVCEDMLNIDIKYMISKNGYQITLIERDYIKLHNSILKNHSELYYKNDLLSIVRHDCYNNVEELQNFAPKPIIKFRTTTFQSTLKTYNLQLNKLEVTFLIGTNGHRIQKIREESNAVIKILPIPKKMSAKELSNPSKILQTVTVTGDTYSASYAVALIESYLRYFKSE